MENASKALVIAGAVLVVILVVTIGAQVYNSTGKEPAEQTKQASEQMWEGTAFNIGETGGIEVEKISTETSYIGCYANLDNDPEPEGIIYADLAESKSGQWYNSKGSFSYEAITTGLKDYYISTEAYDKGPFGTEPRDVITVAPGSKGENRFYVMALEDFNAGTKYCWYDAARDSGISDYATITSVAFGSGTKNTATMIEKWNASAYGKQNDNARDKDLWGEIQEEVKDGWFVPSRGEWSAFAYNLGITKSNYKTYSLSHVYYSSSLSATYTSWCAGFINDSIGGEWVINDDSVRLGTTF